MAQAQKISKSEATHEIYLCCRNPIYFIEKYCKVQHPKKGLLPFILYDYQKDTITNLLAQDKLVINKARQLGISTVIAAYVAWLILFHKDKSVLIVSTKAPVAKNLLKKIKVMLKHIPNWMYLADIETNQAHMLGLSNGSSVKSIARSEDAGRSEALSLLIIDEAAHIRDMDELWKGLASTVATGGKVIANSTPKGSENWFYNYCKQAQSGENDWHYQEIPWWAHPEYSENLRDDATVPGGKTSPWFEAFTQGWSRQQIAQELLTAFTETGDTYLEPATLAHYEGQLKEPLEKTGPERGLWIWKQPEYKKTYIIASDIASGTAEDYTTAIVLEPRELEIVAEFKGKIQPDDWADYLNTTLGPMYNNALIVPENNNVGMVTALSLRRLGYKYLAYFDQETGRLLDKWQADYESINPGFQTNLKTRPIIMAKMEEFLRKKLIKSYSRRLHNEFLTFAWINGKPQAKKNKNDDLIVALAIAIWINETYFQHKSSVPEDIAAMYRSVQVNQKPGHNIHGSPGSNRAVENIKKIVENQKTFGDPTKLINISWIYKT